MFYDSGIYSICKLVMRKYVFFVSLWCVKLHSAQQDSDDSDDSDLSDEADYSDEADVSELSDLSDKSDSSEECGWATGS